ncbi:hypothetical protein [Dictyobacter arantiisoli]|uniref:hypothetical protein n=1 Tax=Dictyobacter arantiisoli TaxID=2014874 RepID=UPI0011EF3C7F|nr:hypothetical protein [Dictyobacter arantiisoli]
MPCQIINTTSESPLIATFKARPARVLVNRELYRKDGVYASERSARHIEFELPADINYQTGFHLGIVPHCYEAQVARVARHFGFTPDPQSQRPDLGSAPKRRSHLCLRGCCQYGSRCAPGLHDGLSRKDRLLRTGGRSVAE